MASKDDETGKGLSSDEILDSLEKDVAADAAPKADADEPVVPPESGEAQSHMPPEFHAWPVDPDHRSARDVLLGKGAREVSDLDDDAIKTNTGLNFFLLFLFLAIAGVGGWQLLKVSSPEALAAKRDAREAMEKAHLEEQLSKQKKYGVLRIESNPAQALVFKDGEKIVTKNEATGEEIVGKTPMNMMNLDIAVPVKIKIELDGHEPYEFNVAQHLWTKDAGTGEYKFFKLVDLTPNICEYWFLYDAKRRKEMKFADAEAAKGNEAKDGKSDCQTYFEEASRAGTSVTECTCKIPPEGWEPPAKKGEKAPKKGK